MSVIYRYEVPVDDQWHELTLSGAVVHVDSRRIASIEVWALCSDGPTTRRQFRVYGTGQPIDEPNLRHVGTAVAPTLVWHLMERPA